MPGKSDQKPDNHEPGQPIGGPGGVAVSTIHSTGQAAPSIIRHKHFQVAEEYIDPWIQSDDEVFSSFFKQKAGFLGKQVLIGTKELAGGTGPPGVEEVAGTRWVILVEVWRNNEAFLAGNTGGEALVQQFNDRFAELTGGVDADQFHRGPINLTRRDENSFVRWRGAGGV